MLKDTELWNTLVVYVGGFGLIAGLLRYVDDWREKRNERPIPFSIIEALWEGFSGGITAIGVFWVLQGYSVNPLVSVGISFMCAYLGVRVLVYYLRKFLDGRLGKGQP